MVLVRGDPIDGHITQSEAKAVLAMTIMYYMTDDLYNEFVVKFNKTPELFDYERYSQRFNLSMK